MSYTNSTPNYNLPQWIGTDKPTFLGDFNGAFSAIDTAMKDNADASSAATSTANAANATAVNANTNANTALNTANNAKDTADAATAAAAGATSTANTAKTTANNAARAALSNNVANLAPAYDNTLTYAVGDLVTYVDDNNTGKLYRCIVAVNTPMDFNVNYWDDVTTSECYSPKKTTHKIGDYTTTNTWEQALTDAATYLVSVFDQLGPDAILYYITSSQKVFFKAEKIRTDATGIQFCGSSVSTNQITLDQLYVGSSGVAYTHARVTTTGTTITDSTSDNFSSNISFYVEF